MCIRDSLEGVQICLDAADHLDILIHKGLVLLVALGQAVDQCTCLLYTSPHQLIHLQQVVERPVIQQKSHVAHGKGCLLYTSRCV